MAEEKTKEVYARLTRDFVGTSRRRGPVVLTPGPKPELVQVTEAELEALENDKYIELVDKKEAKKWNDLHAAQNPEPVVETPDEDQVTDDTEDADDEVEVEISEDTPFAELKAVAKEIGVENVGKIKSRKDMLAAIEAKQATPDEDQE